MRFCLAVVLASPLVLVTSYVAALILDADPSAPPPRTACEKLNASYNDLEWIAEMAHLTCEKEDAPAPPTRTIEEVLRSKSQGAGGLLAGVLDAPANCLEQVRQDFGRHTAEYNRGGVYRCFWVDPDCRQKCIGMCSTKPTSDDEGPTVRTAGKPKLASALMDPAFERFVWLAVKDANMPGLYEEFLKVAPPNSPRRSHAQQRVRAHNSLKRQCKAEEMNQAFATAREDGSAEAYQGFLEQYPQSPSAGFARNRLRALAASAYREARKTDTLDAYQGFLGMFPNSSQAKAARARLELPQFVYEREWRTEYIAAATKDASQAYQAFLAKYPNVRDAADARIRLQAALIREPLEAVVGGGRVLCTRLLLRGAFTGEVDGNAWDVTDGQKADQSGCRSILLMTVNTVRPTDVSPVPSGLVRLPTSIEGTISRLEVSNGERSVLRVPAVLGKRTRHSVSIGFSNRGPSRLNVSLDPEMSAILDEQAKLVFLALRHQPPPPALPSNPIH